jgi:hypothetical protein
MGAAGARSRGATGPDRATALGAARARSALRRHQRQVELVEPGLADLRGGAHQQVLALIVIGKVTASRKLSAPASSITTRSRPGAWPRSGGGPYWKARNRAPNGLRMSPAV